MSKGDSPALRMRLDHGRLVPESAYDQERLSTYRNGSVIHVTIWQKRNEKLLRKYWALLHRAVADCPTPWENAEEASDALKMALGITDFGHSVNGQRFLRPGSISFSTMDEAAFSDFYEKAMGVLARVTGVDPETLHAESADVGHDEHQSTDDAPPPSSSSGEGSAEEDTSPPPAADPIEPTENTGRDEHAWLKQFAKGILAAVGPEEIVVLNQSKALHVDGLSEDTRERARSIVNYARAICRGEIERSDAVDIIAGKARCEAKDLA